MLSAEALAFVPLMDRSSGLDALVTLRGVRSGGSCDASRDHVSSRAALFHAGSRESGGGPSSSQQRNGWRERGHRPSVCPTAAGRSPACSRAVGTRASPSF